MAVITTDCRPLSNAERLALWYWKAVLSGRVRWFNAWPEPLKLPKPNEKEMKP